MDNLSDEILNYNFLPHVSFITDFIVNILTSLILGLILSWHYNKFYHSLSRSNSMTKTLVSLALITCFIITVVKSSLALSLGLVGALSIVRFRTPIKEPYELTYIFISISIGLGLGANQRTITILSILIILIVLYFLSKNKSKIMDGIFFVSLNIKKNNKDNLIIIKKIGSKLNKEINLRRIDLERDDEQINFNIRIESTDDLIRLKKQLNIYFKNCEISIVDGQRLTPF
jgi:hypothetical protein